MSAPRWDWVHLVGPPESHRYDAYVVLCGAEVATSDLPATLCPADCDCELVYCLGCLRAANGRNGDGGVEDDCPPGVRVRMAR